MNGIEVNELEVLKLIKKLYDTDDGSVGGYGHIVFDDGNLEDVFIKSCIDDAIKGEFEHLSEETRKASLNALISFWWLNDKQRELVYDLFWKDRNTF